MLTYHDFTPRAIYIQQINSLRQRYDRELVQDNIMSQNIKSTTYHYATSTVNNRYCTSTFKRDKKLISNDKHNIPFQ